MQKKGYKSRDDLSEDEVKKTSEKNKNNYSKRKFKFKSTIDFDSSDSSCSNESSSSEDSENEEEITTENNYEGTKPAKMFTKTNENKAYDSKMFNIAMEKSLLFYTPCFACSEETTVEEMHPRKFLIGDSFLAPLKNHRTDTHPSYNDQSIDNDKEVHICKRCYKGLKSKPDVLKFSSKNNLDFGEIPEVLKRLNIRELKMVKKYSNINKNHSL